MIIDLESIGNEPNMIETRFDPAEIDLEGESVVLTGNIALIGETVRVGVKAHLRGVIDADVSLDCTRCLEPIAKHFDFSFRAIFVNSSDEDARAEAEVGDELLDESLVDVQTVAQRILQ